MKHISRSLFFAVVALGGMTLAGCDSTPLTGGSPALEADAAVNPDIVVCQGLTSASQSGDESMRAAFVSTAEGRDYGGGVIRELTAAGHYRFLGGEMVGDTCYAYAQARGEQWGKVFNLAWRCPAKVVIGNPAEPGKSILQVVEDRMCDFDAEPGAPARREVPVEMIRQ